MAAAAGQRAMHRDGAAAAPSVLEAGALPVEDLAALAWRESIRPRPVYQAHKWFARRFGTAFRALLTAAALPDGRDFWQGYYEGTAWAGKTVLDPFVGGGTSVIEAFRLGADVVGVDIDAVACSITRFEAAAAHMPDLRPTLERLQREIGAQLAPYYCTTDASGISLEVLHYFWVQTVPCIGCGEVVEAHPHYQLAFDAEGTDQWVFCPGCHAIQTCHRAETYLSCPDCGTTTAIGSGTVRFGRLSCPRCGARERLIDVAPRTGRPPDWRLFALEYLDVPASGSRPVPLRHRSFRSAATQDVATYDAATAALEARRGPDGSLAWIPDRLVPVEGRADDRLPRYGYRQYQQLFNPRQLLHLSLLAEAIAALPGPEQEAFALAFSDHLTTNCMMTSYARGWRRTSPLFSIRAFRHIARPVELNPWLAGTGRGTFPNAIRQVQRATQFARQPVEPLLAGGFQATPSVCTGQQVRVYHRNAASLTPIPDASVPFVLTDPPYFDNIAYSELSDFFLPWLQQLGVVADDNQALVARVESLAAHGRDANAAAAFGVGLSECFAEIARVLTPDGRFVFTFRHRSAGAWLALAHALAHARLRPLQIFPLFGDARNGLHTHAGSSRWDAVFVMAPDGAARPHELTLSGDAMDQACRHCARWTTRLAAGGHGLFRPADGVNLLRACLVGAALGLFPGEHAAAPCRALGDALTDEAILARPPTEPR